MKIDGKNYQVSKSAQEILLSELNSDKKEKMQKFFNIFDTEGGKADGKLSQNEISKALETLQKWEQGKKADGELTDKEIKKAIKQYPELKGLSKKEAREFIKMFLSLNEQKVLAEEAKASVEVPIVEEATETAETPVVQDQPSASPADAESAEKPETFDYVVPEGQSFKALMKKVLIAQGKKEDELTDEDYAKAEEQFRADNPNTQIRGNKVKYLLAGERVKVSVDFGEELLDSAAEEAKWAQKVAKRSAEKADRPDPKVVKAAEEKGLRQTDNKNYFYDEATKTHYRYKDGKFVKYPDIKLIRKDGTYVREYKNSDGSLRTYEYSKDGYPTSLQGRNFKGHTYLNEKKQVEVLGLRETFASSSDHIYYDPKTKMHFKWNDEKKNFEAMDKDVKYVGPDGRPSDTPDQIITKRDEHTGELKTRTEKYGEYSYTYDKYGKLLKEESADGSSTEFSYDSKGHLVSSVEKKNGMVESVWNYSYDNEGRETQVTHRDSNGRLVSTAEYRYVGSDDTFGDIRNDTYKDGTGKLIKSVEWHKNDDGEWSPVYKDGTGKVVGYEEYHKIEI